MKIWNKQLLRYKDILEKDRKEERIKTPKMVITETMKKIKK